MTNEIEHEQAHLTTLYGQLDRLRERSATGLAEALRRTGGTPGERTERDGAVALYADQVAQYGAVEDGLCFGRLDFTGDETRYIGRIGIFDEERDLEPLLIDWRAPAARPFYLATAAAPEGVRRRRHLRTRDRRVVDLDDEVLDLDDALAQKAAASKHDGLTGEAVLLAALGAKRTGRMRDIVETIQAEQDRIIRADVNGVLVVQGGPGTGKTAVALHRAAYLLYTHRRELATRGVLVLGPNETFLRYIGHVLPSLAETGVLLRTLGGLFPGVTATRTESPAAAALKGRLEMVDVLTAAIRDRQRAPETYLDIPIDQDSLHHDTIRLERAACEDARARARATGKPHNLARATFENELVFALSLAYSEDVGLDPYADDPLGGGDAPGDPHLLDEADLAEFRRELRGEPGFQTALDWLWPTLTPEKLLTDLYASADRLAAAGGDVELLLRERGEGFTPADVPLLDEAAELLGEDDRDAVLLAEVRRRQRNAYAEGALEILHGSRSIDLEDEIDPEILVAADVIGALRLGERHEETERLTAAERAAADRRWAFGHVIVDEAQELSPMAWRLLMRRCPSRSMTVVGDLAQTSELAGAGSWAEMMEPYVADRWRLAELTVNYRTPAEVMEVAARVLTAIDPAMVPPRSVRDAGTAPWLSDVDEASLSAYLVKAVEAEVAEADGGRVGVILPAGRLAEAVHALPNAAVGADVELEHPIVLLTVHQAKGLEFDGVVVVDPEGIVEESPRGLSDLYVALTRSTQRLGIICPGSVPALFR
ncbi:HelD family protein [Hamadaea tsunoensis]|uniref:HelD family protein n=1 Tax=Hamadaea tsunoensis TaxID=53368 RepID=UPI0004216EBC|nr:ATP-binding domain-containing protein [Hamadaea tsunoensis]